MGGRNDEKKDEFPSPLARDRLLFSSWESSRNFHPFLGEQRRTFHPGTRQRCVTAGSKSILRNIETPEGTAARRKRSDAVEERRERETERETREEGQGVKRKYGKKEILKIATLKRACTPEGIRDLR